MYFDLDAVYFNNSLKDYLISLSIFVSSLLVLRIIKGVLIHRLKAFAKKTGGNLDDIIIEGIDKITWPFYVAFPIYVASIFLTLPDNLANVLSNGALIILVIYIIRFLLGLTEYLVHKFISKNQSDYETNIAIERLLGIGLKIVLWVLGILLVAQNMGLNVTALLGGLGIGGIAIAFALQKTLGDLFSFFSIYFDKPFTVGDFIATGEDMGTVEQIGIKSTRIRTLQGEELILPNSDLTASRINNYRKMENRRVALNIGVTYKTDPEKLEKIPEMVMGIINNVNLAKAERAHFKSFGASALLFEIIYFIDSSDYNVYMDIQQKINSNILKAFIKEKIDFAYPTQQLFIKQN